MRCEIQTPLHLQEARKAKREFVAGGISLELSARYAGGGNGSKPPSRPGWRNESIGPPGHCAHLSSGWAGRYPRLLSKPGSSALSRARRRWAAPRWGHGTRGSEAEGGGAGQEGLRATEGGTTGASRKRHVPSLPGGRSRWARRAAGASEPGSCTARRYGWEGTSSPGHGLTVGLSFLRRPVGTVWLRDASDSVFAC